MTRRLVRARAPLRLGFGGGGTDVSPYCDEFGGVVLNAAINRFCHVTIDPRDDGELVLRAPDIGESWSGEAPAELAADSGAPALMRGVYNRVVRQFNKAKPLSVTVTSFADAPAGSGLGTSSAMVVTLLSAFRLYLDLPLGIYDLAQLAYEIERVDLGLAGGKQDQYAAAFGGINFMEFYDNDRVIINPLRVSQDILHELESSLIVYFTGQSRASAQIIEDQQRHMKAKDHGSLEALHSMKRSAFDMKEALLKGEICELATFLDASWTQKKRTASAVATAEIDAIYQRAIEAGAYGGKVSGAGGGGFMMFLTDPPDRERLIATLRSDGGHPQQCQIWQLGVEAWRP